MIFFFNLITCLFREKFCLGCLCKLRSLWKNWLLNHLNCVSCKHHICPYSVTVESNIMVVGIKDIPVHQRCTITTSLGSLEILPEFIYTPERGFVTFFVTQKSNQCIHPKWKHGPFNIKVRVLCYQSEISHSHQQIRAQESL